MYIFEVCTVATNDMIHIRFCYSRQDICQSLHKFEETLTASADRQTPGGAVPACLTNGSAFQSTRFGTQSVEGSEYI